MTRVGQPSHGKQTSCQPRPKYLSTSDNVLKTALSRNLSLSSNHVHAGSSGMWGIINLLGVSMRQQTLSNILGSRTFDMKSEMWLASGAKLACW